MDKNPPISSTGTELEVNEDGRWNYEEIAGVIRIMFKVIGTIKLKGDRKDCQMSGDDIQKDDIFVLAIFFNPNHTIGAAKATIE